MTLSLLATEARKTAAFSSCSCEVKMICQHSQCGKKGGGGGKEKREGEKLLWSSNKIGENVM